MAHVEKRVLRGGRRAQRWTMFWRDESGRRRCLVGCKGRRESQAWADQLEVECRKRRLGGDDARIAYEALRPIGEHLDDWLATVPAGQYEQLSYRVRRVVELAGILVLSEWQLDRVQAALGKLSGLSIQTRQYYVGHCKQFDKWLADAGRLIAPRLRMLKRPKVPESSHRRPLTHEEFGRLLGAVRGVAIGCPAEVRAMAYRVAVATGFRLGELRAVRASFCHLAGDRPEIYLPGTLTKNGRKAYQPIDRATAALLGAFIEGLEPDDLVFPLPENPAAMLRVDLEAAGIPVETADGVVDFHSLRHTFVSWLAWAGTPPRQAMELARHSDIKLTTKIYSQVGVSFCDLHAMLDRAAQALSIGAQEMPGKSKQA